MRPGLRYRAVVRFHRQMQESYKGTSSCPDLYVGLQVWYVTRYLQILTRVPVSAYSASLRRECINNRWLGSMAPMVVQVLKLTGAD